MLDADDAILEQAMQTGAALKRARDNQKAARKPRVSPGTLHADMSSPIVACTMSGVPVASYMQSGSCADMCVLDCTMHTVW